MNLASAKVGDLVKVDKKGRIFYAEIRGKHERELDIFPLDSRVSYRSCTGREVKGLWHKSRQGARAKKVEAVKAVVV